LKNFRNGWARHQQQILFHEKQQLGNLPAVAGVLALANSSNGTAKQWNRKQKTHLYVWAKLQDLPSHACSIPQSNTAELEILNVMEYNQLPIQPRSHNT
jgi:hypothetical protein